MSDQAASTGSSTRETEDPPVQASTTSEILSRFPPAASLGAQRSSRHKRRFDNAIRTDLIAWLRQNDPADFAELMDLRRALYSLASKGKYRIFLLGLTNAGERKIKLVGPNSAVMIVSEKSRHYLLRLLCRLRKAREWPPIRTDANVTFRQPRHPGGPNQRSALSESSNQRNVANAKSGAGCSRAMMSSFVDD
ncbi:hypothetical protein [Bradyrhizobium sp. BRP56]|uniref:hypothetical protein n=1 Tax=Bradyrhizobium sp. BRP56 TaxID=2793819 RepID=UPI001CD25B9B|nr:hypothetical protein [Bradyrhizobium sp. BRP56]MCA1399098.1 hypothetical protein [Bradyrhizobium sp. BRP56]